MKTAKRNGAAPPPAKAAPARKRKCAHLECPENASTKGFCRSHYISNWKTIKLDEHMKAENRLNSYVDRMSKRYPKDFLERIREGLESEEKFRESIQELKVPGEEDGENDHEFLEKFLRDIKFDTE